MTAEGVYAPWERAVDLRHALDHLLAHREIGPRVDAGRIGSAGFSLGGWTALLLVGGRPDFDRFRAFCAGPQRDAICQPQREYPLDFTRQPALLAQPHAAPLAAGARQSQRDARIRSALLLAPALGQALDPASLGAIQAPVQHIPGARLELLPGVGQ
jgi:predicted dienelactone hydrolase